MADDASVPTMVRKKIAITHLTAYQKRQQRSSADPATDVAKLPLRPVGMCPWRVEQHAGKQRIVHATYQGKWYDKVYETSVAIGGDFEHTAYVAQDNGKTFVVVDQREEPPRDHIALDSVQVSNDGSQVTYYVQQPGSGSNPRTVVRNGTVIPGECIGRAFSPNGRRYALVVFDRETNRSLLHCDGKVVAYDAAALHRPTFTPDSGRLACVRCSWPPKGPGEGLYRVVIDGQPGPAFAEILASFPGGENTFFFSEDGKHVAYVGRKGGQEVLVVDQQPVPTPKDAQIVKVSLSPNGEQLVFVATTPELNAKGRWFVSCGGRQVRVEAGRAPRVGFSPNGRHAVFAAPAEGGDAAFIDGIGGPVYHAVLDPEFLTDNRIRYLAWHHANDAQQDGLVVEEEVCWPAADAARPAQPLRSPDSGPGAK